MRSDPFTQLLHSSSKASRIKYTSTMIRLTSVAYTRPGLYTSIYMVYMWVYINVPYILLRLWLSYFCFCMCAVFDDPCGI